MSLRKSIVLLLLPLYLIRAEDSYTAIMQYLQSQEKQSHDIKTRQTQDQKALKSLLIHPQERREVLGKAQYNRPSLPESYISSDGHFKIHYTTTGYNAVETISTNPDGVPDFVYEAAESAEYAYRILIDTLGFDVPPEDGVGGVETDIYIQNLGGMVYAYTYPEYEVSSTARQYDYTAYMEIDNDYRESAYSSNGLDGLRVTTAHEFFHVVQLGYNWFYSNDLPGSENGDTYFLEWSSTWFEERAHPQIDDYIQYVYDFFYSPGKPLWDYNSYGYAMGPFIYFLQKQYGDELLPNAWEKIKNQYAFQALEQTLEEYGGDLANQYNNYVAACYYTGSRYDELHSVSADAAQFPDLAMSRYDYQDPLYLNAEIRTFASYPLMISFDSDQYLNLSIDSQDNNSYIGSYMIDQNSSGIFKRKFGTDAEIFIGETRIGDHCIVFLNNSSIEDTIDLELLFTSAESVPTKILKLYANPYTWKDQNDLHVEFQLGKFVSHIRMDIFNIRGQRIFDKTIDASDLDPGILDLVIAADELLWRNISSGIYFLQITTGGRRMVQKFTIIN